MPTRGDRLLRRSFAILLLGLAIYAVTLVVTDSKHLTPPTRRTQRAESQEQGPVLNGAQDGKRRPSTTPPAADATTVAPSHPITTVRVLVLDADSGSAIGGARALASAEPEALVAAAQAAISDGAGVCVLELPEADAWITVSSPHYVPAQFQRAVPRTAGPEEYEIRLERGRTVEGIVVGPAGVPVAGAVVCIGCDGTPLAWQPRTRAVEYAGSRAAAARGTTDLDGRFSIDGLPLTAPLQAWAGRRGWSARRPPKPVPAGKEQLRLELQPSYSVVMHYRSKADGSPVDRIVPSLTLSPPLNTIEDAPLMGQLDQWLADQSESAPSLGGREIRFRLLPQFDQPAPEGARAMLRYEARCPGFAPARGEVQLIPGEQVDHTVELAPTRDELCEVEFTAAFEDGSAYSGPLAIWITASGERDNAYLVEANFADGLSTSSAPLPRGVYVLTPRGSDAAGSPQDAFWNPAGAAKTLDLTGQMGRVRSELVLAGGRVALHVVDDAGRPVRGFDLGMGVGNQFDMRYMWDMQVIRATYDSAMQAGPRQHPPMVIAGAGYARFRAELPNGLHGEASVQVPSDGTVVPLTIQLRR